FLNPEPGSPRSTGGPGLFFVFWGKGFEKLAGTRQSSQSEPGSSDRSNIDMKYKAKRLHQVKVLLGDNCNLERKHHGKKSVRVFSSIGAIGFSVFHCVFRLRPSKPQG